MIWAFIGLVAIILAVGITSFLLGYSIGKSDAFPTDEAQRFQITSEEGQQIVRFIQSERK